MVSNKPLDQFTLMLEDSSSNDMQQERVIATNIGTQLTAEAALDLNQVRALLEHVYSEPLIVENQFEHVKAGHTMELLANSKDPCVLTAQELTRFGFDPEDLRATERADD